MVRVVRSIVNTKFSRAWAVRGCVRFDDTLGRTLLEEEEEAFERWLPIIAVSIRHRRRFSIWMRTG